VTPASPIDPRRPFTVGLTGGIGSGKSTVAQLFAAHGIAVIDTDLLAHQLTAPGGAAMPAIRAAFGAGLLCPDGAMDRAAMRQRVFADRQQRTRLEDILHPMIRSESLRQLAAARSPYALLVVPLLVESPWWRDRCDRILVVDCPPEIQEQRVMARSGLPADEVRRIMASQASRETRLAVASECIDNGGRIAGLEARVAALHAVYLEASTTRSQGA